MRQKYFKLAPLALCICATPALAQQTDTERLEQLEQQVLSLQQQVTSTAADRVQLNGFFSTGYATASNDAGLAGITEEAEITDLSLMALQGTFTLSDDTQAIMQLVSRGEEDWDTELEWAYLSHQLTNDIKVRAGKMRLPFFMYSDSLEVGYAQPWARPPTVVYNPTITSYVGADATYTYNLGSSSITTQIFGGNSNTNDTSQNRDIDVRNVAGLSIGWSDYVWSLRALASTAETNMLTDSVSFADNDRTNFFGLGFGYDDGTWQIISEVIRQEVDGVIADTDSAYISVGRRIGSFTPYAVVGWTESKDDDERASSPLSSLDTRRDEYSLGMRWDVLSGVAVKFDWTHARGFGEKPGGLDATSVFAEDLDSTNVYTVKIDSAF